MVLIVLAAAASDILPHLTSAFGGGVLAYIAVEIRKAYTTYAKKQEHREELDDKKETREADDSRSFALEANLERKETLRKVEAQAAEITRLSVEIARCTAKHELNELRDAEKDAQIRQLNVSLELTQQLVARQKEEISAQEQVIGAQGLDIIGLHSQIGELRSSLDTLVKQVMGVKSISEVPGPGGGDAGETEGPALAR